MGSHAAHKTVGVAGMAILLVLGSASGTSRAAPVAWWTFNDGPGSGTAVNSVSPYHGALQNMDNSAWSTDTPSGTGYSLGFDGTNQYVNVPDHEAVDIGTSSFSVSMWLKRERDGRIEGLLDHESGGANLYGYQTLLLDNNRLRVRVQDRSNHVLIDSNNAPEGKITADGEWHHVVFAANRDPNSAAVGGVFYIDGVRQAPGSMANVTGDLSTDQDFWIGILNGNEAFQGNIDEVQVYQQALPRSAALYLRDNPDRAVFLQPIAPEVWHSHDAAEPGSDPTNTWTTTTEYIGRPITWTTPPAYIADDNFAQTGSQPGIAAAYQFDGSAVAQFQDLAGIQNTPVTFEVWFRPADNLGQEVLLELGGSTGTSFSLDGEDLRFVTSGGGTNVVLPAADYLTPERIRDFVQVVGVIDPTEGHTAFYVDGQRMATVDEAPSLWTGTDDNGLGGIDNLVGGASAFDFTGYENFEGEIAIYRMYQRALSPGEVWTNYRAVVPEPASVLQILFCGLALLVGLGGRRRHTGA